MSAFNISSNYNKTELTTSIKPSITNTVNVINKASEKINVEIPEYPEIPDIKVEDANVVASAPPSNAIKSKILPPKNLLMTRGFIDESIRTAFEKRLLSICLSVLSTNDKVLVNNIIDISGDIILSMKDLKELITLTTKSTDINIVLGEHDLHGCCSALEKLPIWFPITKIIVNGTDFYVEYNKIHTMFSEYHITLEKVIP
jgi:hypothetical protein